MGATLGRITMRVRRTKGGSVKRSRLSISKLLAVSAAVALLASGCGGPKVPLAESQAAGSAAVALGNGGATSAGGSNDAAGSAAVSDSGSTPAAVSGSGSTPGAVSGGGGSAKAAGTSGGSTSAAASGGGGSAKAAAASAGPASAAAGGGGQNAGGAGQQQAAAAGSIADRVARKAIFGGNEQCGPANGTPVSLGNVSTLSGVLGELFSPVVPALKTFVSSQNACGGLNGHPIKLTIADDQGDPSTAVTEGRRLVKEGIVAFLGNIQVLTIDAMTTVVKESGVPIIGGDLTNNTWFTNPLLFPQGSPPQAISYGYHVAASKIFNKKKIGNVYCLEVPQACKQINTGFQELDAAFPDDQVVYTQQISITSPDYTSQCLDAQRAGVEMMAITNDAPTQSRWSNSCAKVGFKPDYVLYPLGVGNEHQFLGNPNLGNGYVPMNHFPWMAGTKKFPGNAAMQYYQQQVAKYNPGFNSGGAAALGWQSGALLVAGSVELPAADQPVKTQDFLKGLYQFKGQDWTTLGGLSGPLVFTEGKNPFVKYCLYGAQTNADNSAWARADINLSCTDLRAPSDPNQKAP
jgi:branched-chain amino acid transport system substrate-binding protein